MQRKQLSISPRPLPEHIEGLIEKNSVRSLPKATVLMNEDGSTILDMYAKAAVASVEWCESKSYETMSKKAWPEEVALASQC